MASLRFGTRVSRVLARVGIGSVGQLVDMLQVGLPGYPDFGHGSAAELSAVMEKLAKKSAVKKRNVEARYSVGGSAVFYFRAKRFHKLSGKQLNRPVEVLGLGQDALRFARTRCLASSLGRFLEKCADGVRNVTGDDARSVPQIVNALSALNKSVADSGKVDWKTYRRLSGLIGPSAMATGKKPPGETPSKVQAVEFSYRATAVANYPGCSARVHFNFPELAPLAEGAKSIALAPLLSRRAFNIYSSMGVGTLGALVALAAKGFSQPIGFGRKCYTETAGLLQAAASVMDPHGHIDLPILCESVGRPLAAHPGAETGGPSKPLLATQFPVLRYTSENLERLSDEARSQPLHNLHLDSRAATTMENHSVQDVGTFVDKLKEGINANRLRNFGRRAFNEIAESITALSSSIDAKGECDWTAYASARGFKVLPSKEIKTPDQALVCLADVVEQAVEAQFKDQKDFGRRMDIFKRRLHAQIGDYLTLEQLGTLHSLSREMIRQNEMHIAGCLHGPLLKGSYSVPVFRRKTKTYEGLRFRFRLVLENACRSGKEALIGAGRKVWRFDDWVQFLSRVWNTDARLVERNALLLSMIFGFSFSVQTAEENSGTALLVAEDTPAASRLELREILKDIRLSMQGTLKEMSTNEILAPFDAGKILSEFALKPDELLALSPAIVPIRRGVWKIKPEFFKPRIGKLTCDAVYDMLTETGSRMHNTQLLRRFKLRHPDLLESDRLLTARIFLDPRFRPIGRSGYWVLAEWNQETGTIRDVIAKVLEEAGGPMHINDILRAVRSRVPCRESSVRTYLAESPEKYIKLSSVTYGLASRYPNRLRHEDV